VFTGLLQLFGVGSILPFVALLSNSDLVEKNHWLHGAYVFFGFTSVHRFLIGCGVLALAALLIANLGFVLTQWINVRVSWSIQHGIATRLFERYLRAPYVLLLRRSPADLKKNILEESQTVGGGVVQSLLQLAAAGFTVLVLTCLLLLVNPLLTLLIGGLVGGGFGLVYLLVRRSLQRMGDSRFDANTARYKAVDEGLGGLKELRVLGRSGGVLGQFSGASLRFVSQLSDQALISQLPRYLIEVFGFGGILLVVIYMMARQSDIRNAIPLISLFAFAGYRMLPAANQAYTCITNLRFFGVAVRTVAQEMRRAYDGPSSAPFVGSHGGAPERLPFSHAVEVKNLHFAYSPERPAALLDVSLTVPYKSFVGIVGATGSGKTTLADVILGLLPPQAGELIVDGELLTAANLRAWQNTVGYVPQDIYLADDTIAHNIAFGVPPEKIDMEAVRRAAQMAQIHMFIEAKLPDGYETLVGDRGVRLSGGQRQRIGIARALYHNPEVLILDEATSMLDGRTEADLMQAIEALSHRLTLLVIAHRLTTVAQADRIYLLEEGRLEATGTYAELMQTSERFRKMAGSVEM
jgi:ATP-binding cassette subfamily C protein